jgi:voltage-gated potassium channel
MVTAAMAASAQSELVRRGRTAFVLGASVLALSTLSYYALGCFTGMNAGYGKRLASLADDRWELSECLYASAITLTTVGYTDVLGTQQLEIWRDTAGRHRWVSKTDPHQDPGFDATDAVLVRKWSPVTRVMTAVQSILGIAFFLYVIAQVTSFFVEGAYEDFRVRVRSRRQLRGLSNHVILCGAGESVRHAVDVLKAAGVKCAAVEFDHHAADELRAAHPSVPVLEADATEEGALEEAGLSRARALVAATGDDGMNTVVAVTARQLRPELTIVARGFGASSTRRLAAAGCAVVSRGRLAGLRLASDLARPTAAQLLERVLPPVAVGELQIREAAVGETFAGRLVGDLAQRGIVPLALHRRDRDALVYNPADDERLMPGDAVTVLATPSELEELEGALGGWTAAPPVRRGAPLAEDRLALRPVPQAQDPGGHYLVCGASEAGIWVARELAATGRSFLVVDSDEAALAAVRDEIPGLRTLAGDLESPETLAQAGVAKARGVGATSDSDRSNFLVVVTARQARADLRIASLAWDAAAERRLRRAGVDCVSPGLIGGRRLAAEVLQPELTGFLDRMLVDPRGVRVESVAVRDGAPAAGLSLGSADLPGTVGVRAIALLPPGAQAPDFVPNPGPEEVLVPGTRLVALADPEELQRLAARVGDLE